MVKFEKNLKENGLLIYNTSLIDLKPSRTDIKTLGIPVNAMAEESGNPRGINMVVLGVLAKLFPEMLSKHAHFTAALDEAISERNKKFNPLNIATIESICKRLCFRIRKKIWKIKQPWKKVQLFREMRNFPLKKCQTKRTLC